MRSGRWLVGSLSSTCRLVTRYSAASRSKKKPVALVSTLSPAWVVTRVTASGSVSIMAESIPLARAAEQHDADEDQDQWPPLGDELAQVRDRQDLQVDEQEHDADQDQDVGAELRTSLHADPP